MKRKIRKEMLRINVPFGWRKKMSQNTKKGRGMRENKKKYYESQNQNEFLNLLPFLRKIKKKIDLPLVKLNLFLSG